jgi:glycosyltransferase involved in cell wall biosynthesis
LCQELSAGLPPLSPELWHCIEFKNHLTHVQIAAELSRATMAVCASRADVSPNAVKEAVVAGVPVVGTQVGGIPDYVHPDRNGILCEAGNVEALTQAIRTASQNPMFRAGLVDRETLAAMRSYLSAETMGRKFRKAYDLALEEFGRKASRTA